MHQNKVIEFEAHIKTLKLLREKKTLLQKLLVDEAVNPDESLGI